MNTLLQTQSKNTSVQAPSFMPAMKGLMQRKCTEGDCRRGRHLQHSEQAGLSGIPPIVHEVLQSPGEPLDHATRVFMEQRFGHDFNRVKVHTDTRAQESARAVNAFAYTVGQDVVFRTGQYAPGTYEGRRLLAHELTHVVQQEGTQGSPMALGDPGEPAEAEADTFAHQIQRNTAPSDHPAQRVVPGIIQRQSCWEELISSLPTETGGTPGTFFRGGSPGTLPAGTSGTILWRLPVNLDARLIAPSIAIGTRFRVVVTLAVRVPLDVQERLHLPFTGAGILPINLITGRVPPNPDNELCLQGSASLAGDAIMITGSLYRGSVLTVPVVAAGTGPGISLATGTLRVTVPRTIRASIGPFSIGTGTSFTSDVLPELERSFSDILSRELRGAEGSVRLSARASAGVQLPVPGMAAEQSNVVPINAIGDATMEASVGAGDRPDTRRVELRATGAGEASAAGGLIQGDLNFSGRFASTLPGRLRLRDFSTDLLRDVVSTGEGSGEISGHIGVAGIPGRLSVDFVASRGTLRGTGTFISPIAAGGGRFTYDFQRGLSADIGMLGIVSLATSVPEEERRRLERSYIGPGEREFPSTVYGLGITGIQLQEDTSRRLSIGAGPELITEPSGERKTGFYAGFDFRIEF